MARENTGRLSGLLGVHLPLNLHYNVAELIGTVYSDARERFGSRSSLVDGG